MGVTSHTDYDVSSFFKSNLLLISVSILLFLSVFSSSSDVSTGLLGNIFAFSSYILFLFIYVYKSSKVYLPKKPLLIIGSIYLIFIFNFIRANMNIFWAPATYPTSNIQLLINTGDLVGYIVASFTLLFIIPQVLDRDWFFIFLACISTLTIILGLLAYVFGDYYLAWIKINTYTSLEPLRQYGIMIPALASFWADANAASKVIAAGLVGSHYLYVSRESKIWILLIVLNGFGLFLANSMMAIIALIISYTVFMMYKMFDEYITLYYLLFCVLCGSAFYLIVLFDLGLRDVIPEQIFSGRLDLWNNVLLIIPQHPIFGVGISNIGEAISVYTPSAATTTQNSYFRLLVASGTIGGSLYIWFVASSVIKYLSRIRSDSDLILYTFFILFVLAAFTDTVDPFGVNKNSVIFSISFGYIIYDLWVPETTKR